MSIAMDAACFQCHMGRYLDTARVHGDEATATRFSKELMKLYLELPEEASAPELGPAVNRLLQEYYGLLPDRLRQEKEDSNRFVLERMEEICRRVDAAEDPLLAALRFAVLGNYLDFAALAGRVSFAELDKMLDEALSMDLVLEDYQTFHQDLAQGKNLLYLTDNAGEIGFDRIFAEKIREAYPHLQITFCVRGGPVQNDATREDAVTVGVPFPVLDNGNTVGGTVISLLSKEAGRAMETADVIIAKGMGNTETLYGCGRNVYYAFLVKCQRIATFFGQPMMTPVFLREPGAVK